MAVWKFVCSGTLYGMEKWANVFHMDIAGDPNEAGIVGAFQKFYSTGTNNILLNCAGTVGTNTDGVKLTAGSLQAVTNPAPPRLTTWNYKGGQNTAGGLPVDVSLCISWRTGRAGRSFRGRTYLPPFHSNRNNDGAGQMPAPITSCVQMVRDCAATLLIDLGAVNAPLVVRSARLNTFTPITGGYVDNEWDTQRRRSRQQPSTRNTFGV